MSQQQEKPLIQVLIDARTHWPQILKSEVTPFSLRTRGRHSNQCTAPLSGWKGAALGCLWDSAEFRTQTAPCLQVVGAGRGSGSSILCSPSRLPVPTRWKWEFKAMFSYIREFKFKLGYGNPPQKPTARWSSKSTCWESMRT